MNVTYNFGWFFLFGLSCNCLKLVRRSEIQEKKFVEREKNNEGVTANC